VVPWNIDLSICVVPRGTNHHQNFRRQLVESRVTLQKIFKEATIAREKQCDPALEKTDRRNKTQMYRGREAGCKDCQPILNVIHGR